jgi:L-ascorbate metabolism protein UlaG (beta-lactamase superfamily)
MIITYNTLESFKIQLGDTVIAVNPVSKRSTSASSSFGADIVLTSLNHEDVNGIETVARGDAAPFVISGPGEYEVSGVFVRGFSAVAKMGGVEQLTTIYSIILEDSHLCFLGTLGAPTLSPETLEALPDIDILFIPVGGDDVLDPKEAHKLISVLEPRITIPMHYTKESLSAFLKEEGATAAPLEKLTIKKKEILEKAGQVIVLSPQSA